MSNIERFLKIVIFIVIAITSLTVQAAEELFGYDLSAIKDELRKIVVVKKNHDNIEEIQFDFHNADGNLKPMVLKVYDSKTTVFKLADFPEIVFKPSVKKRIVSIYVMAMHNRAWKIISKLNIL